ncbi:MAG: hypothetical protein AAGF77_12180, partial [Bacteroidota bacterium]
MKSQDITFNYKIILAALVAVILALLIAFYYSYAQTKNELGYLEDEKQLLVKELALMKAEVDRLSGLNEINDIELQTSKFKIEQLLDSVGRLNFTVDKMKDNRKILRKLESRFDSLKLKNNFLRYSNSELSKKFDRTKQEMQALKDQANSSAELAFNEKVD